MRLHSIHPPEKETPKASDRIPRAGHWRRQIPLKTQYRCIEQFRFIGEMSKDRAVADAHRVRDALDSERTCTLSRQNPQGRIRGLLTPSFRAESERYEVSIYSLTTFQNHTSTINGRFAVLSSGIAVFHARHGITLEGPGARRVRRTNTRFETVRD